MTNEIRANETLVSDIPAGWRLDALAQLQTGENVLAVLEVDLNQKLFFNQNQGSLSGSISDYYDFLYLHGDCWAPLPLGGYFDFCIQVFDQLENSFFGPFQIQGQQHQMLLLHQLLT